MDLLVDDGAQAIADKAMKRTQDVHFAIIESLCSISCMKPRMTISAACYYKKSIWKDAAVGNRNPGQFSADAYRFGKSVIRIEWQHMYIKGLL